VTQKINMLQASHYAEDEQKMADDPIVQDMFSVLPPHYVELIAADGAGLFELMLQANQTYQARGGEVQAHLGAVLGGLRILAEQALEV